jgi:hypothetical protein
MRNLLTASIAGFLLAFGAAGAQAQLVLFRPALDGIGNAEPPASEGVAQSPDGVDFAPDEPSPPAHRGKVIIDSATAAPANSHLARRHRWEIAR